MQGDVKSYFQQTKVIETAKIKWMVGLEISALSLGDGVKQGFKWEAVLKVERGQCG